MGEGERLAAFRPEQAHKLRELACDLGCRSLVGFSQRAALRDILWHDCIMFYSRVPLKEHWGFTSSELNSSIGFERRHLCWSRFSGDVTPFELSLVLSLIYTLVSNPDLTKTKAQLWLTQLDFAAIMTLVCCSFPFGAEQTCIMYFPRTSLLQKTGLLAFFRSKA